MQLCATSSCEHDLGMLKQAPLMVGMSDYPEVGEGA